MVSEEGKCRNILQLEGDVDDSTKKNVVKNLERKIRKLTTKEEDRVDLEESLWGQLKRNGYIKKKEERKRKELREKEEGEERKEEEKWYGLTSMGRYTERLKQ